MLLLTSCGRSTRPELAQSVRSESHFSNRQRSFDWKECIAAKSRTGVNQSVKRYVDSDCGPQKISRNLAFYKIKSFANQLYLELSVLFLIDENLNQLQVENSIKDNLPCVRAFFKRYQLELILDYKFAPDRNRRHTVQITSQAGRSRYNRWFVEKIYSCAFLIHELSHLLGLPDRYQDEACPQRSIIGHDPKDIMTNVWANLDEAYFTEQDLQILVGPICTDWNGDLKVTNHGLLKNLI